MRARAEIMGPSVGNWAIRTLPTGFHLPTGTVVLPLWSLRMVWAKAKRREVTIRNMDRGSRGLPGESWAARMLRQKLGLTMPTRVLILPHLLWILL
jgi:hypothetical protein